MTKDRLLEYWAAQMRLRYYNDRRRASGRVFDPVADRLIVERFRADLRREKQIAERAAARVGAPKSISR